MVGAVHPICKGKDVENRFQWRLSFSRAEIVLVNSWLPVQQIVYHVANLREDRTTNQLFHQDRNRYAEQLPHKNTDVVGL